MERGTENGIYTNDWLGMLILQVIINFRNTGSCLCLDPWPGHIPLFLRWFVWLCGFIMDALASKSVSWSILDNDTAQTVELGSYKRFYSLRMECSRRSGQFWWPFEFHFQWTRVVSSWCQYRNNWTLSFDGADYPQKYSSAARGRMKKKYLSASRARHDKVNDTHTTRTMPATGFSSLANITFEGCWRPWPINLHEYGIL